VERRVYFYYRDAGWQVSVSLPVGIHIDAGDHVVLEMETDKPYQYHTEVASHYRPARRRRKGTEGQGEKGLILPDGRIGCKAALWRAL